MVRPVRALLQRWPRDEGQVPGSRYQDRVIQGQDRVRFRDKSSSDSGPVVKVEATSLTCVLGRETGFVFSGT